MAPAPRRRCLISCCWPVSSHHWYRPVRKRSGGGVPCSNCCHSWPYTYSCASPRARRLPRCVLQYGLLTVVLALLLLWLGAEHEQFRVRHATSTTDLYTRSEICGILVGGVNNKNNASSSSSESSGAASGGAIEIETFASVADFRAADPYHDDENDDHDESSSGSNVVAHCGECGACSNPGDVRIYDATRNTLFQDTTRCAKMALIFGRKTARKCMADAVGFTPDCGDCWVENIMCDLRYCIFTCLWYGLFSQVDGGHDKNSTKLNPCTFCDEMRCGRGFVNCAGANRRRAGMLSDIERDAETEVCRTVTDRWWNDESLQAQWRAQQLQQQQQQQQGSDDDDDDDDATSSSSLDVATAPSSPALRNNNNKNTTTSSSSTTATELLAEEGGLRRLQK